MAGRSGSKGQSVVVLLTMIATFTVSGAIFLAIDAAAGVRVGLGDFLSGSQAVSLSPSSTATETSSPSLTAAPTHQPGLQPTSRVGTASATLAATTPTATVSPTETATPWPTPPGGVTPPRYGTLANYPNNTIFSATFLSQVDEQIISLTNDERAKYHVQPLLENANLDVMAASRSQDLIQRNYFDHLDPTGPLDSQGHRPAAIRELLARNQISFTDVGENLISNTGFPLDSSTAQQAVQAWMNHPEHRDNLLASRYSQIGVGIATENQKDGLRVVITQVFLR